MSRRTPRNPRRWVRHSLGAAMAMVAAAAAMASSVVFQTGPTSSTAGASGGTITALNSYSIAYRPGQVLVRSDGITGGNDWASTAMSPAHSGASAWGLLSLLSLGALGLTAAGRIKRWRTTLSRGGHQPDESCDGPTRLVMQDDGNPGLFAPGNRPVWLSSLASRLRPVCVEGRVA